MEKSIKLLSNRKRDIKNIFDDIQKDDEVIVKDIYELDDELYQFMKSKDELWLENFYIMIKSFIDNEIIFDNAKDIRDLLSKSKYFNKKFFNYFFDGIKLFNVKKEEMLGNDEKENSDDYNDDATEIENNNKILKDFKWREGQLEAIEKIRENDFKSGLVSMITGSGKSLIFLRTIHEHVKIKNPEKGSLYILTCPRIDIIRSLFFKYNKPSNEYSIDDNKLDFWKKNKIANFKDFNIIDRINDKNKLLKLKLDNDKYNLLLINNDYLRSFYKNEQIKNTICLKTNLLIIDECHCISGGKFYNIIEDLKYNYKVSIMGFSATPIRGTSQSELNTINIFSKTTNKENTNKKINLIYSYDLVRGIMDGVVLPYRIRCVKINKMGGLKIGATNKEVLYRMLQDIIEKKKKLPYSKIIIWTNTRIIMKECYDYIENKCNDLKVYCTSSFDKEMKAEGYNTNYEEFYQSKGNCILVCINKCKEGSDIPNVDCGIYFDGVKNRSILVHIQTSGRIIRPDEGKLKTHGDLIDTFILDEDESSKSLTAIKILSYLTRLLNLADDEYEEQIEMYKKMSDIARSMDFDEETQTLKIAVDKNNSHTAIIHLEELKIYQTDWKKIQEEVFLQVDKKFKISKSDKLKLEYEQIKEYIKDLNIKTNYEYSKKCCRYNLPFEPEKKYSEFWKNWYDFLNLDIRKYPDTIEELKELCKKYKITNEDEYYIKCETYELPLMPVELYGINIFKKNEAIKRR